MRGGGMPNETQGMGARERRPPTGGEPTGVQMVREAAALAEFVRLEHGRDGVRRYVAALAEFLPRAVVVQLSDLLNVETPPERPPAPPPEPPRRPCRDPGIPPEKLIPLLQSLAGGKEHPIDPMMLMTLLNKQD